MSKVTIKEIVEGKRAWRAHIKRVKKLPQAYQIVYHEIQRYLYKVGPIELNEGIGMLTGIVDLFEDCAAAGKDILSVTGQDVAAFCDDLIKGSKTYSDHYQESVNHVVSKAMKKISDKEEGS